MPAIRYTFTAIRLHWLSALLIFIALPLGMVVHDMPLSPQKLQWVSYHKWLGITVLLLTAIRLAWRAGHRPPALPDSMPRWQHMASHGIHHLLYLLLLAIPLSGWLMSSAKGFQTVYLGLIPLPDLIGKDKALAGQLFELHAGLCTLLMVALAAHIGAALKHHFIDRDDILARMVPFLSREKS